MQKDPRTAVLFNADCPICRFEIGHYARYSDKNALPIRFDDLNSEARLRWGLDANTAAQRLYVLHDGQLAAGVPAFIALWSQMPRYRWLARISGLPGVRHLLTVVYDYALAPGIYHWHLHRVRKRARRLG